jgi:endoglucanase
MDLRNELRKAHGMSATWGDGNPLTDWKRAAKICSDIVQTITPHWLIFVSGLDYQLDLTGVYKSPLELKVPNKLVYTGHFYGFSWVSPQITSWNMVTY